MKKMKILILICASLVISATSFAENNLPEGVSTSISKGEIEDILMWANNSKSQLEKVNSSYVNIDYTKRAAYIKFKVEQILKESGKAENELLMRITLNRVLELHKLLDQTPKSLNFEYLIGIHMLENGIELAKSFYEHDLDYLSRIKNGEKIEINFSSVSKKMLQIFTSYAKEISDSKKIEFKKMLLSWYLVDLNKTASLRREKAQEIKDLYELLNDNNGFYSKESLDEMLNVKIASIADNIGVFPAIYDAGILRPGLYYSINSKENCVLAVRNGSSTGYFDLYIVPVANPLYRGDWSGCSEELIYSIKDTGRYHVVNLRSGWYRHVLEGDEIKVRNNSNGKVNFKFLTRQNEKENEFVYWKSE